jgi:hypothetical protein
MQTGCDGGYRLKDTNLLPPVFDHLLTPGSQPCLWLKDRAQGEYEGSRVSEGEQEESSQPTVPYTVNPAKHIPVWQLHRAKQPGDNAHVFIGYLYL